MLFFNPLWFSESERLGLRICSPLAYALRGISDLFGFTGLLSIFCVVSTVGHRAITGNFDVGLLWLLVVPFAFEFLRWSLFRCSYALARRRRFHFDYESGQATWDENGQQKSYEWKPSPDSN